MFLEYFKLTDQPFGATPDPRFLFQTASHREALASLYTGFYGNRGFTVLIAEPGMGKTTLLFDFLDHIRDRARTVFLFDTLCGPTDVLSLILQDLGLTPGESAAEKHRQLNEILAAEARIDRKVVLVLDEAQNLSLESLEAVRLLTNFETSRSKLMQVVLAGQPQLADKLARAEVSQLLQRVSTMCRLAPFSATEVSAYINFRLKLAGYTGGPLFTSRAQELIANASHGIPRVMNTLCFNSLCLCRARNTRLVDEPTVAQVIGDLQLPPIQTLPVTATAQPESQQAASIPVSAFSEVAASSSKTARYIIAALLSISIGLSGSTWWMNGRGEHDFPSALPALLHIWHAARVGAAKDIPPAVPPVEAAPKVAAAPGPPPSAEPIQPNESAGPKQVTVAAGETLETIARTNVGSWDKTTLRQIRKLNPHITDPNHIEVGRTIRLPGRSETHKTNAPMRSQP